MERMKEVRRVVRSENKALNLVNISVDPENDSPTVLADFAHRHGADVANWWLLTGDYKQIAETCESGFKMGLSGRADASKPDFGITHGSHFILVDGTGVARAYFPASDESTPQAILRALDHL
jgi:protein SCO1/2